MSLMIRQEERGKALTDPLKKDRGYKVSEACQILTVWRWRWWRCWNCLSLISLGWNFRFWQRPWQAEHLTCWWCNWQVNNESWLKTQACGLGRSKRVGYDRLGMLSLTTWDGMGHSIMREWLPCLCCLLKGRVGYLAERVDKAERVQTLLQSALQVFT